MIYFLFFEILVTVASSEEKTHKKGETENSGRKF